MHLNPFRGVGAEPSPWSHRPLLRSATALAVVLWTFPTWSVWLL